MFSFLFSFRFFCVDFGVFFKLLVLVGFHGSLGYLIRGFVGKWLISSRSVYGIVCHLNLLLDVMIKFGVWEMVDMLVSICIQIESMLGSRHVAETKEIKIKRKMWTIEIEPIFQLNWQQTKLMFTGISQNVKLIVDEVFHLFDLGSSVWNLS